MIRETRFDVIVSEATCNELIFKMIRAYPIGAGNRYNHTSKRVSVLARLAVAPI